MSRDWLGDERSDIAAEKILDAAGVLFADRGVAGVGMGEIARAAGCSRATLYRYFETRRALHLSFVHRETRRIGAAIRSRLPAGGEPGELVVEAMLIAVRLVRADPILHAWFRADGAGLASEIAGSSVVIETFAAAFLADAGIGDERNSPTARWIVRIILSLLIVPGTDDTEERAMLTRFVAPLISGESLSADA
ncbi:TetR/AcrR family transcriptional regulator [Pseudonocardia spinosispora]|uniref:TetR/AcrR family transcriptional regulator n=1 Tax=Pseudonocardia spinosispora TaxID=103441 RepID=UPI000491CF90|nr:TetR/AcrR family transcriptional regulator [Pseudonocardia spinosispora]